MPQALVELPHLYITFVNVVYFAAFVLAEACLEVFENSVNVH